MSANEQLADSYTRHQIVMQRYGRGVANKTIKEIDRLMARCVALIESSKSGLDQLRYVAMYRELEALNRAAFERIGKQLDAARTETAAFEVRATASQIEKYTDMPTALIVPDPARVVAIANAAPLTGENAAILATVLDGLERKTLRLVNNAVRDGVLLGRTAKQIASDVQALTALNRRNAQSVALTAIAQVTAESRKEFHRANADILEAEEFTATLDSRTTIFCAGHDSKQYPVGTGPRLPAHYRCRSVYVPVVKEEWIRNIPGGGRAAVGSDGKQTVSGQTTYQSFLRRQSAEFQNEVLGVERAKLFRSGKLSIDKFSDDSGKVYTLDELHSMYPSIVK